MTPHRERSLAISSRWFSIAGLAIVALVAAKLVVLTAEPVLDNAAARFSELGLTWVWIFSFIILTAVLVPLASDRCGGFIGFKYFKFYPPIWLPVAIGLGLAIILEYWCPGWRSLKANEHRLDDWAAPSALACISLAFFLSFLVDWIPTRIRSESRSSQAAAPRHESIRNSEDLLAWIATDDEPVKTPDEDLFDHTVVAARIARRLSRRTNGLPDGPTFVVIGPRGIGKTSIFHLIQHQLKIQARASGSAADRVPVGCIRLSAWKYADTRSLLRGVLSAIISYAHTYVDAWALTGLPSSYVDAVSASGGLSGTLARLLAPLDHQPDDVIKRITSILRAIDLLVVVWIDDLERFTAQGGSAEPIRALLEQFRQSPFITFVLAESQE
jgi:hypothetical protein